jgi:ferredoxin-type protein NapG
VLLRPPGALPEEEFLARCTTSGRCIQACPVAAIKADWSDDPRRRGRPIIEARLQACVVCDDLSCMKACPTGALRSVPREEIDMGLAVVRRDACVRGQGEECQICVDKCPLGSAAITIPYFGAEVVVNADGCTGCGVCEMYCPTEPRAIVIEPTATGPMGTETTGIGPTGTETTGTGPLAP